MKFGQIRLYARLILAVHLDGIRHDEIKDEAAEYDGDNLFEAGLQDSFIVIDLELEY